LNFHIKALQSETDKEIPKTLSVRERLLLAQSGRSLVRRFQLWANLEEQKSRTTGPSTQGILDLALRKPTARIAVRCRRPCSSDLSTKKSLAAISPFTVLRRPVALRSGSPGRATSKALGQSNASFGKPVVALLEAEPFSRWSAIGYPSRWLGAFMD
jgi:hypothetical protein